MSQGNLGVAKIEEHKSVPEKPEKRRRKFPFLAGAAVLIALVVIGVELRTSSTQAIRQRSQPEIRKGGAYSDIEDPLKRADNPRTARAASAALFSDQSPPGRTEFGSVAEGAVTVAVTASESKRIALLVQKGAFPKSRVC
jgi:cytoskeletal protein RodZ